MAQDDIALGEILRKLRLERDVNQSDLADLLKIERQTYGSYERGKSMPSIENLCKLADYFCVTVDYLVGKSTKRDISVATYAISNIHDSPFVQGLGHLTMNSDISLSREEKELIHIYRALDTKGGHKLLDYAFKLEQGENQQ